MKLTWRDVFDAQKLWPAGWERCHDMAVLANYKYIAFNGNVLKVGRPLNYRESVCTVEDLDKEVTQDIVEENMYNQYIVNFRNNLPLTVWAKSYEVKVSVSGMEIIEFIDLYDSTNIKRINSREVLYIEIKRAGVALEK